MVLVMRRVYQTFGKRWRHSAFQFSDTTGSPVVTLLGLFSVFWGVLREQICVNRRGVRSDLKKLGARSLLSSEYFKFFRILFSKLPALPIGT